MYNLEGICMKRHFIYFIFSLIFVLSVLAVQSSEMSIPQIVAKYGKAIVLIATVESGKDSVSLGSGFIVDPNGIIVTNYHVIQGAYPAYIKLASGDIYDDISIIDFDARRDIAVMKIKAWNLPTVKLGDSDFVLVGEEVVAIGNPQGLEHSVTDGIVSGKRDTGEGYLLHQISTPISPGSSGSPVFNMKGQVIGIACSSLVQGQNLNFAIPINYARAMISNNIKMSLEEFSKLNANSSTRINKINKEPNQSEGLKILSNIIVNIYKSYDLYALGIHPTVEPHETVFDPNNFSISTSLYYAKETIEIAREDLAKLNDQYNISPSLLDSYRKLIDTAKEGIDLIINGLKNYYSEGFPNWDAVKQGIAKFNLAYKNIGIPANKEFLQQVRKYAPELTKYLLPIIIMSEWFIKYPVDLGIVWAHSRWDVSLISVYKNGIADKAGLRPGDQIIKEQNSIPFKSVLDFHYFLMRLKKGTKIRLFFERDGKSLYADISL